MKTASILLLLFLGCTAPRLATDGGSTEKNSCNLAVTYAEMSYAKFKKAYNSTSEEEIATLLKKGTQEAQQASAYAISSACNCSLAKNYALNAVTFGNKAKRTTDVEARKKLIKEAMDSANNVLVGVNGCKQNNL